MKTFIFGAGASILFFEPKLNTDYLTAKVRNKEEWNKVIMTTNRKTNLCIGSFSRDLSLYFIDDINNIRNN